MATAKKLYVGVNGEAVDMASAKKLYVGYNNVAVEVPLGGEAEFDYKTWLASASISATGYATLDSVLADDIAVRKLMTIHAAVDYLASWQTTDANIVKILNNDLCAKWITLRDYALDTLDKEYRSLMESLGKYYYGEWAKLSESPETWGPKGNVPIMTSDTAPYGTAISSTTVGTAYAAWKAFDDDATTGTAIGNQSTWSDCFIGYIFTNPVCIREVSVRNRASGDMYSIGRFKVQGSNDTTTGSDGTWTDIASLENTNNTPGKENRFTFSNTTYYLAYRLYITSNVTTTSYKYVNIAALQCYGREMKISVPVMTSNTAPYGVASASSESPVSGNAGPAYFAFDYKPYSGGESTFWGPTVNEVGQWVQYDFGKPVFPVFAYLFTRNELNGFTLRGSNDLTNWTDLSDELLPTVRGTKFYYNTKNEGPFRYFRIVCTTKGSMNINIFDIQIWGKDYSEYDWDTVNPRHYLYDHGVELETITSYTGDSSKANVIKGTNNIKVYKGAYFSVAARALAPAINMASYNKILVRVANEFLDAGTTNAPNVGAFTTNPTTSVANADANKFFNAPLKDVVLCLDISSISQSAYPSIQTQNGGGADKVLSIRFNEWWLE